MSDQWQDVVEQERRAREQRVAHDKYHGTQEMYRLEQEAAREGHFHGQASAAPPSLLEKIKRTVRAIFGRG